MDEVSITAGERRWLAFFALAVLAVLTLPYVIGYATQGGAARFSGFILGVEDGNSYIAKMRLGSQEAWLFRTPYTSLPQTGVLAFLPYLLLGKLAAGTALHEQLVALFHLFRIAAGWLMIWATYDFIAYFVRDVSLRRLGLALATLGGGLGWVLLLIGQDNLFKSMPLEFYSPESFGFLSLFSIPHLALGRALLLWGLLAYLRAVHAPGALWRDALQIGLIWLLSAVAQPLYAVIVGYILAVHLAISLVWGLIRRENGFGLRTSWLPRLRLAVAAGLLPAPFILYNFAAFYLDPFLKAWTAQNIILSPHPLHYVVAYGLLLPLCLGGLRLAWRGGEASRQLLFGWTLSLPLLAYLPFNLQRRLPEGMWVALVVLALIYLEKKQAENTSRAWRGVRFAALLLFPSTLILLAGSFLAVFNPAQPVFRPAGEIRAFEYLDGLSQPGDVVLASFEAGNALPAWADVRVVIGHGPESVRLAALKPQVEAFFDPATKMEARLELLRTQKVRYVFQDPEGGQPVWDMILPGVLQPVYDQDGYKIFQVLQVAP